MYDSVLKGADNQKTDSSFKVETITNDREDHIYPLLN